MQNYHKIIKLLAISAIGLLVFQIFSYSVYAQSVDCYDNFIFAWHTVNPVLECLDDNIGGGIADYQQLCQNTISASNASSLSCSNFDAKKHLYVVSEIKSIDGMGDGIIFSDNYSSSTGWTQTSTGISITGGVVSAVNLLNGEVGNVERSVKKDMSVTLDNSIWDADFEFNVSTDNGGTGHIWPLFCLASSNAWCFDSTVSHDMVGVFYRDTANTVGMASQDGTTQGGDGQPMGITHGVTYYATFERTSTTNVKLSVYSDSARTTHITGSPINLTIPSTITDLTHIYHGNRRGTTTHTVSFTIDNTVISGDSASIGLRPSIRFNNDNATNYVYSNSLNLGAYDTVTNTNDCNLLHNVDMANNDGGIFDMLIYNNVSSERKLGIGEGVYGITTNDSTTPNDTKYKCKWDNTSSQITTVNIVSDTAGLFNQNSTITVWGYD